MPFELAQSRCATYFGQRTAVSIQRFHAPAFDALTLRIVKVAFLLALPVALAEHGLAGVPDIVWTDRGSDQILRAPSDGSGPVRVLYDVSSFPAGIDVQGDYVYWSINNPSLDAPPGSDRIERAPLDGSGPIEVLYQFGPTTLRDVSVSGEYVYWVDGLADSILRGPIDGSGPPEELYNEANQWDVAIDGEVLYWTVGGSVDAVRRGSIDGAAPVTDLYTNEDFQDNVGPRGIEFDDQYLFWADPIQDQVFRGDREGSLPPQVLYSSSDYPPIGDSSAVNDLAVVGNSILWVDVTRDQILSAPLDGSGPVIILYDSDDVQGSPDAVRPWRIAAVPVDTRLPGDFDADGVVSAADYALWASSFGSTVSLDADGNGDGLVNAADYTVWRDGFVTAAAARVPEPSTLAAVVTVLAAIGATRAGRRASCRYARPSSASPVALRGTSGM